MTYSLTIHTRQGDFVITAERGQTILAAMQSAAFTGVCAPCGGRASCGKCLVTVAGVLSPVSDSELPFISDGERLACRAEIVGDCEVWIDGDAEASVSPGSSRAQTDFEPDVEYKSGGYGAAVDIGTTTIAVYLYDLSSGTFLGSAGEMNSQRIYGADVISRVNYTIENPNGAALLTHTLRAQVDGIISALCLKAGFDSADIRHITVCGNTIMEHFFAGLSPASIAVSPFTPASLFGCERSAGELLLTSAPKAMVYFAEAVSGFVGGDITCGILASGMYKSEEPCLLLDIGTNGEIALGGKNGIICCATAAGPAFEGAGVRLGMGGAAGAVSRVRLAGGELVIETIGSVSPAGICGSGLIDALAIMLELGAVDETGRLLPPDITSRAALPFVSETPDGCVFWLDKARTVYITANDVRQLQLAKAAVAGGIKVLLSKAGINEHNIHTVYLAGGFGNNIDTASAIKIGLIPQSMAGKIMPIGNAAGAGASRALLSSNAKRLISKIRGSCEYFELSDNAEFMDAFISAMGF